MSRKTRKLIWSAPLVAVLAVAGALAIFVALAPNEVGSRQAHDRRCMARPVPVTGWHRTDRSRLTATRTDWDAGGRWPWAQRSPATVEAMRSTTRSTPVMLEATASTPVDTRCG